MTHSSEPRCRRDVSPNCGLSGALDEKMQVYGVDYFRALVKKRPQEQNLLAWFHAWNGIENVPYEVVMESPLPAYVVGRVVSGSCSLAALRILEYLTGCPSEIPVELRSQELFKCVRAMIGNEKSAEWNQHGLLVLVQMLKRGTEPQLGGEDVADLMAMSQSLIESGMSVNVVTLATYLLCMCCVVTNNSGSIVQLTEAVLGYGDALPFVFLLKAIREMLPKLTDFALFTPRFMEQCVQCAVGAQVERRSAVQIEVFRLFACLQGPCCDLVIGSGIIPSVCDILASPDLEISVLVECCRFLCAVIASPKSSELEKVLPPLCMAAQIGTFQMMQEVASFLVSLLTLKFDAFADQAIECNCVELLLDVFAGQSDTSYRKQCLHVLAMIVDAGKCRDSDIELITTRLNQCCDEEDELQDLIENMLSKI